MDDHQRRVLRDMADEVHQFREGRLPVDHLARNLRGLMLAADFKSSKLRDDFDALWSRIDAEAELRTEPWAPPGLASDDALSDGLDALLSWVRDRISDEDTDRA